MQTISSRILNLLEVVGLGEIGPTEMYFLLPTRHSQLLISARKTML